MLNHFHRKHSGGSPIDSDHTDGTNLGSFQFLNISYNDPENGTREVQLRSPGNTGLFTLSVLHLTLHPAPKKFTNIKTFLVLVEDIHSLIFNPSFYYFTS